MADVDPALQALVALYHEGRLAEAIAAARRYVATTPTEPAAWNLLAAALERTGHAEAAEEAARHAVALVPEAPVPRLTLGNVLRARGLWDAAEAAFDDAIARAPDFVAAHHARAGLLLARDRPEAAVAALEAALAHDSHHLPSLMTLAQALYRLHRLSEAEAAIRQALQAHPHHAPAHLWLARILLAAERAREAEAAAREALALVPEDPLPLVLMAQALIARTAYPEAREALDAALALDPGHAEAWTVLGTLHALLGDNAAALETYAAAEAHAPDALPPRLNRLRLLERMNRMAEVRAGLAEARARWPAEGRLALLAAQVALREGDAEEALAVLQGTGAASLDRPSLLERAFLLGRIHDRLDHPGQAMRWFREGNRRQEMLPVYEDVARTRFLDRLDHIEQALAPERVAAWPPPPPPDGRDDPVFVVGFPRSGTTLVGTLLDGHPGITELDERPLLDAVLQALPGNEEHVALDALPDDARAALRDRYFAARARELERRGLSESAAGLVVDKMPFHLVNAAFLHRLFPEARFVLVQRHPCDSVLSCFMQNFGPNHALVHFTTLEQTARLYDQVMRLWTLTRERVPLRVHTVVYEALVADPEPGLRDLTAFLDVPWDDALVTHARTGQARGDIRTPSYPQVAEPLYTRARERWHRYARFMKPVLPRLLPWAARFGYGPATVASLPQAGNHPSLDP